MKEEILNSSSIQEVIEEIEEMFTKTPDKRKKEYKIWRNEINILIEKVNILKNQKIYKKVC